MADNGRWFKLWCASLGDPDLDALDISDFGRWAKLGAYIKEHGENGEITISEPARIIVSMFQLPLFQDVLNCISKFKNVAVSLETNAPVSVRIKYHNWFKYQGDISTDRVRKFRAKKHENETPKKRGEEKRREESKEEEEEKPSQSLKNQSLKNQNQMSDEEWMNSLRKNPAYEGLDIGKLYGKMLVWCDTNGKKATRKRFVNWLNREELPIQAKRGGSLADKYPSL